MNQKFPAYVVQEGGAFVISCLFPGRWLLKKSTPAWRIEDPEDGFQRMVSEERARAIAAAVLDQRRSFPNAIVLATNSSAPEVRNGVVEFSERARFLVVDGQHRLYAQKFSDYDASYSCMVHFALDERRMAELFIEINDNQKRVPASLRWDLVRLVRADEDSTEVRTADLIYDLATDRGSPLRQRIDLTGEVPGIGLKQASAAPAIKSVISRTPLSEHGYEVQLKFVRAFVTAVRDRDPDGWDRGKSPLYSARVFRALFRLLADIAQDISEAPPSVTAQTFAPYVRKIRLESLDLNAIRAQQGAAGIKAIYDSIKAQVLPK